MRTPLLFAPVYILSYLLEGWACVMLTLLVRLCAVHTVTSSSIVRYVQAYSLPHPKARKPESPTGWWEMRSFGGTRNANGYCLLPPSSGSWRMEKACDMEHYRPLLEHWTLNFKLSSEWYRVPAEKGGLSFYKRWWLWTLHIDTFLASHTSL
jgi:hypothetical protein